MIARASRVGASHTEFRTSFAASHASTERARQFLSVLVDENIRVATHREDTQESTDLVTDSGIHIACRIRSANYQYYRDEVTVTCRRETGSKCEWHKMILGGYSDWFFYSHEPHLQPRFLVNLHIARPIMLNLFYTRAIRECGPNMDHHGAKCWFYPFNKNAIKKALIELPDKWPPNPLWLKAWQLKHFWPLVTGSATM